MGNNIIISESERKRILSLYEQNNIIDVKNLFTQEEIENGHLLYMQKDKFNGNITISTGGWISFRKEIKGGTTKHSFSVEARGRYPRKGVYLLFEGGVKLLKPDAYVYSDYNNGPVLVGFIDNLSQADINLFKTKKIEAYKVDHIQEEMELSYSETFMRGVNTITKITKQNFDMVKKLFDEHDPVLNYKFEPPEKDKEPIKINANFPGGDDQLLKYLTYNLKNKFKQGTYEIKFTISINKEGSITNLNILSPNEPDYQNILINVLKSGPKWLPSVENNKNVDSTQTIEKTITL